MPACSPVQLYEHPRPPRGRDAPVLGARHPRAVPAGDLREHDYRQDTYPRLHAFLFLSLAPDDALNALHLLSGAQRSARVRGSRFESNTHPFT